MVLLRRTNSENSDFKKLVWSLDQDLNSRYQKDQEEYDKFNKIDLLDTVVIAYLNDQAVGCGCFKKYNEFTIEIKRMFVNPDMRGKGIAKKILSELELWGIQLGFTNAILETGIGQPEAIGLYEKLGYKRIPNYDQYAGMPGSVCMKKEIHH
jgi:putative acetyltransferase